MLNAVPGLVFLAQLHHGLRPATGARVGEANRFHAAEGKRLVAPGRHHLDGKAAFEVSNVLELARRHLLGLEEGLHERVVLLLVERAVDVGGVSTLVVARSPKRPVEVDGIGRDDRCDSVVVGQMLGAHRRRDVVCESPGSERPRRDDDRPLFGNPIDDFMNHFNKWVRFDAARDFGAELLAVDGERPTCGHLMKRPDLHDQRTCAAHLFLEQADCIVQGRTPKRVGANQLCHLV